MRCGECNACKTVEATKNVLLVESAPAGPGLNEQSRVMWNTILRDNPCEKESGNERDEDLLCFN